MPVITARQVEEAARAGQQSLAVPADAVVTPSARDAAAQLGVTLQTGQPPAAASRPPDAAPAPPQPAARQAEPGGDAVVPPGRIIATAEVEQAAEQGARRIAVRPGIHVTRSARHRAAVLGIELVETG